MMNTKTHNDPVCGMQIEEMDAAGQSEHDGRTIYFCSSGCKEKFDANPAQFKTQGGKVMNESNKTTLVIALVVVVVFFLVFGGGALNGSMMNGGMMNGGMMGQGRWSGGFGWMWIPTLLTLGIGVLLGWMIFGQKK